jgi:hypothetical protein
VRDAREAKARIKEHQTGNPREVVEIREIASPMVQDLETQLHHRLAACCVYHEWFCLTDDQVDALLMPQAQCIVQQQEKSLADFKTAAELATCQSNGQVRDATEDEVRLWEEWCDAVRKQTVLKANMDIHRYTLLQHSAGHGGIAGVVDVIPDGASLKLDTKQLLKEFSEVHQACMVEQPEAMRSRCMPQGKPKLVDHNAELFKLLGVAKAGDKPTRDDAARDCRSRDGVIVEAHQKYIEFYVEISPVNWQVARLEARLRTKIGQCEEIEGVIKWRRVVKAQSPKLDTREVQEAHPEAYKQCCVPNPKVKLSIRPYRAYPC